MISPTVQSLLDAQRAEVHGEYTSISRLIDVLLDLRSMVEDRTELVSYIDEVIRSVPGRSVATNEWWLLQLDLLEIEANESEDGNREPATAP